MTPVFILVAILLVAVVLLALAYPILRSARGTVVVAPKQSAEETYEELAARREAAFQAIRDLQFDRDVGKITDADFEVYRADLKGRAADSLREVDAFESDLDKDLNGSIEALVAAHRKAMRQPQRACQACGQVMPAGNEFCTNCGTRLAPAERAAAIPAKPLCPSCGNTVAIDDRFCPRCGQALATIAAPAAPNHA